MIGLLLQIPLWLLVGWMALSLKRLEKRGRKSPFNENFLSTPGHSIRIVQRDNALNFLLYLFATFATPYFFYAFFTANLSTNILLTVIGTSATAFFFYRSIKYFKLAIRLHLAVEAETCVGQELNLLMRDGAWVFHDIPYQYGNIDHIVIAPGGVFAIETKGISKPTNNDRDGTKNATISVENGVLLLPHAKTKKPVDQAKTHAHWLRNEIQRRFGFSVPVRAVVAIPGWMIKGGFDGECWVVNPKRGNALRAAIVKPVIEEAQVNVISAWVEDLSRSVTPKSKEFDAKREMAS